MNGSDRSGQDGAIAPGTGTQPHTRPRELEDWLNFHVFHPLSGRMARWLARTSITPNMVSAFGGLCVVAAAGAYAAPGWPLPAICGLTLHLLWHVIDGADGDLARLTGKAGPMGEVVDGLSDYLSHIVLYCVLATILVPQIGFGAAWAAAIGAGASRIVQANHYEVRRRQYQWWVHGHPWLEQVPLAATGTSGKAAAALARGYLSLAGSIAGQTGSLAMLYRKSAENAAVQARFRAAATRHFGRLLAPLGLLSANYRTIALGIAMLVGSPLWFFLYEIAILNPVLLGSWLAHGRAARRVATELEPTRFPEHGGKA